MTDNSPAISSEVTAATATEKTTEQQTNVAAGTEFARSDEIYREAAVLHTIIPAPSVDQETEPVEQPAISAADITAPEEPVAEVSESLTAITAEEPSTVTDPVEQEVAEHITAEVSPPPSPEEPSLISRFTSLFEAPEGKEDTRSNSLLDRATNFCDNLRDMCAEGAREYSGTLWGTFLGFASSGFDFLGSITESISSAFETESELSNQEREYFSQNNALEELTRTEESEIASIQTAQPEVGFEAGDIAILRNERIRRMKELLEQLHEVMEQYREHHEREEEKENENEIEFHFQKQEELVEVVKEIQDLLPDHPKVREALESYRVEKYRDELPPDVVYQEMRDILAEALDEETRG